MATCSRCHRRSRGCPGSPLGSCVYVLWGSTYLANRFVLPSVPPLLVGGFRFLVGGALLAGSCSASPAARRSG